MGPTVGYLEPRGVAEAPRSRFKQAHGQGFEKEEPIYTSSRSALNETERRGFVGCSYLDPALGL